MIYATNISQRSFSGFGYTLCYCCCVATLPSFVVVFLLRHKCVWALLLSLLPLLQCFCCVIIATYVYISFHIQGRKHKINKKAVLSTAARCSCKFLSVSNFTTASCSFSEATAYISDRSKCWNYTKMRWFLWPWRKITAIAENRNKSHGDSEYDVVIILQR